MQTHPIGRLIRRLTVMRRLSVLLIVLAFSLPATASAATTEVAVRDFAFDPSVVTVSVGDSVHWSREAGSVAMHSVTANNGFFASGAATSGAIDLTATFSAGTFHYYCMVHGSPGGSTDSGMNGLVKVPATVTPAPSGGPFTVRWAVAASGTGSTYDVQYRIGTGKWKAWLSKTSALKAVFGKNGKPVAAKAGTAYSFRVRSRTGQGPSRWSPAAPFTP